MADLSRNDAGLRELALFAGAGGGILGGHLIGWRTVCAVEWEPYPACVLAQRQNDGLLPPFPIWDDVRTFDGRPWRGRVDVVSGGFPCQDISVAGKGAGITGERSGLWVEMARIIGEVRPRYAFVENSPMLTVRGLGVVLGDLAAMGFDARWGVLGAADVGAPHLRERIWIVADADREQWRPSGMGSDAWADRGDDARGCGESLSRAAADANSKRLRELSGRERWAGRSAESAEFADDGRAESVGDSYINATELGASNGMEQSAIASPGWWQSEPDVGRVADGVAARVDRLKAIGNGQVPLVAATAWRLLTEEP